MSLPGLTSAAPPLPITATVAAPATALSWGAAYDSLTHSSDQLAAAQLGVQSARLRREGMQGLGGPSVSLTGMAYVYNANLDINMDPANRRLSDFISQLPPEAGSGVAQLPSLPSNFALHRRKQSGSASISAVWPLYIGGLGDAVRSELDAKTDEALAQAQGDENALTSLLAQRYFGAQLAAQAALLREAALQGIRQHDAAAQSMLQAGVIARVERLQASAALQDAEQQAAKARDQANLAARALTRTLKAPQLVTPTTPLFVSSQPLPALTQFLDAAYSRHPGLDKVQAKKRQASHLLEAQEALRRPQVLAFGMHELTTNGKPNWIAGMAVRWTLWDAIDRDQLSDATRRQIEQVEHVDAQLRNDLGLLVEKNWLSVEHARTQYLAQQGQQDLAQEMLRLRQAGLREGTSTTLDLIDAQLHLAKVQTERAEISNQYVQALAALLESTGQSQQLPQYIASADIQLPLRAPMALPSVMPVAQQPLPSHANRRAAPASP